LEVATRENLEALEKKLKEQILGLKDYLSSLKNIAKPNPIVVSVMQAVGMLMGDAN